MSSQPPSRVPVRPHWQNQPQVGTSSGSQQYPPPQQAQQGQSNTLAAHASLDPQLAMQHLLGQVQHPDLQRLVREDLFLTPSSTAGSPSAPPRAASQPPQPPQQAQPKTPPPAPVQEPWQQPLSPQPRYQPPPPHRSRGRLWLVGGITVAVLVLACIGASVLAATQKQTPPAPQANTIGMPVQSGDWAVTVNSAKLSPGVQFKQPTPGHLYLVVNVSLKNTASDNQVASSLLMFSLRDSTGQTYNEVRTGPDSPDGTVLPSETSRGNVSYEVPANFHTFTFGFQPGALNTDRVEWTLTV